MKTEPNGMALILRLLKIRLFGVRSSADKLAIVDCIVASLKNHDGGSPYTCHHAQNLAGIKARRWLFHVWESYMGPAAGRNVFGLEQWDAFFPMGLTTSYPEYSLEVSRRLCALSVLRVDIIEGKK